MDVIIVIIIDNLTAVYRIELHCRLYRNERPNIFHQRQNDSDVFISPESCYIYFIGRIKRVASVYCTLAHSETTSRFMCPESRSSRPNEN